MSVERWVIDTNVLISAALLKGSVPAVLLQEVLAQRHLVFTTATFAELESRLWRPKFDRYVTLETRKQLLADLAGAAEWVEANEATAAVAYSRDPADDMFIHAALAAGAPWLVSRDADLLTLGHIAGTRIVTPAQALQDSGLLR